MFKKQRDPEDVCIYIYRYTEFVMTSICLSHICSSLIYKMYTIYLLISFYNLYLLCIFQPLLLSVFLLIVRLFFSFFFSNMYFSWYIESIWSNSPNTKHRNHGFLMSRTLGPLTFRVMDVMGMGSHNIPRRSP